MASQASLRVARTWDGYCLRVEGSATIRESRAAKEFVWRCINDGNTSVTMDLSGCQYMDSTFLGCLINLHRRFGQTETSESRFKVAAPSHACRRAFEIARMDTLLSISDQPPAMNGDYVDLPAQALNDAGAEDLARHIIECHRQLADLGGPSQEAFRRIADAFQRELENKTIHV